ncbi:hypothetical protein TRFO_23274 [Tritrichomonas foetus]|uniref:Cation efflux protein transmembrane domain-containing protein n=1 Tax=Tritrichomonas foetus TaxID=1144522 RepID=A0A1J4KF87_9EUKA|nr:hypothetical protein TRFO_23274 [Tritrichomonas foetus]|eukprot:OHT08262.1 hypothetical protein TRFO_23274 [Tritrichomonas foetus]
MPKSLPHVISVAYRDTLNKKIRKKTREFPTVILVCGLFLHSILSKIIPSFLSTCFISLLIWSLFSKMNFTPLNFLIPFSSLFIIFLTISSKQLTFLHRCFILIFCKDIQYEFSIESRRKNNLAFVGLFFCLFHHITTIRTLFTIAVMCFSALLGVLFPFDKSKNFHIQWNIPTLLFCITIQLYLGERIKLSTIFFIVLTIIDIQIKPIPKLQFSNEAKRLLSFFTINFIFMFAEFYVGFSTNSLGMISDAFHMMCDNTSLFFSSLASILSHNGHILEGQFLSFPFGLKQIESVCTFANTILLFFISFNLLSESIQRLLKPPKIGEENLIIVSVLGFLVNLVGLFFTDTGDKENTFMKSINLHILVDTLGSVAVIISSICISKFNIYICDPICSFLISISIFYSTIPLIKSVISVLMLELEKESKEKILSRISNLAVILKANVWNSGNISCVDMQIKFVDNNNKDDKMKQVNDVLSGNNVTYSTIEIIE